MTEQPAGGSPPLKPLILVPILITLAITLLRLTGEVLEWSPALFNREPGGPLSIVGIVWLVPVFGVYFAVKLVRMGNAPDSAGRAVGVAFLSLLIIPAALFLASALKVGPGRRGLLVIAVASIVTGFVAFRAWPALGRVLFAYGLGARIPVAAVMLVAILSNWGTHYEKAGPGIPEMAPLTKWFWIGLVPQLTIWMAFTLGVGILFGGVAVLVTKKQLKPATA